MKTTKQEAQVKLRLPLAVKDKLQKEADANRRSMGSEIAYRLEQSLEKRLPQPGDAK